MSEEEESSSTVSERTKNIWYDFTQVTTIHGVRFIAEKESSLVRRLFWGLVVALGFGIFIYQVTGSLINYYAWPMSVNIKINYNETLKFPAITICNQNAFKATKAVELGWYPMIQDLWDSSKQVTNARKYGQLNITDKDFWLNASHTKEDFIQSCKWRGVNCSSDDFQLTMTDHGVCYSFNYGIKSNTKWITDSGSQQGLQLRLNIEQYEYMIGPNDAAGIKVLVHDQNEIPLVKDFGLAVSPGAHAFTAVKLLKLSNMKAPHGKCVDNAKLKHYKTFSIPACKLDRKMDNMVQSVGCRHRYMGDDGAGSPPVCNLTDLLVYWKKQSLEEDNSAEQNEEEGDTCPLPCERELVEPYVSLAKMTSYNMGHFITPESDILDNFHHARETAFKIDKTLRRKDRVVMKKFNLKVLKLGKVFDEVVERLRILKGRVGSISEKVNPIFIMHSKLLEDFEINFEINYYQYWEAFENRVSNTLFQGFNDVIASALKQIEDSKNKNGTDTTSSIIIDYEINKKEFILKKGLEFLANLKRALLLEIYAFERPHFISGNHTMHNEFTLLKLSADDKNDVETAISLMEKSILQYIQNLHAVRRMTQVSYPPSGRCVNQTDLDKVHRLFESIAARQEGHRIDFERLFQKYKTRIGDDKTKIAELHERSSLTFERFEQSLENPYKLIANQRLGRWERIKNFTNSINLYMNMNSLDVKRETIANECNLRLLRSAQNVATFFEELKTRAGVIINEWIGARGVFNESVTELRHQARGILNVIYFELLDEMPSLVSDDGGVGGDDLAHALLDLKYVENSDTLNQIVSKTPTLQGYQNFSLIDEQYNASDWWSQILIENKEIEYWIHINDLIKDSHLQFLDAFMDVYNLMKEFKKGNIIDDQFIKDNFIQLDVYMQDLSYEHIRQQESYDMISLLGDIGGSMGLFVGASCITLFEFLDTAIYQLLALMPRFKKNPKQNGGNINGGTVCMDEKV